MEKLDILIKMARKNNNKLNINDLLCFNINTEDFDEIIKQLKEENIDIIDEEQTEEDTNFQTRKIR